MALNLATVLGQQYDPNQVAKDFTTMVKVKQFTHEEDAFDDLFQGVKTFTLVLHSTSLQLSPDDINAFHVYRNKILLSPDDINAQNGEGNRNKGYEKDIEGNTEKMTEQALAKKQTEVVSTST